MGINGGKLSKLEEEVISRVSADRISDDLRWFEAHGLRLGGTDEEAEAATYVVERLREAGVDVRCDEFRSFVSHPNDRGSFGPASVELDRSPTPEIAAKAYLFSASTTRDGVAAPIVHVGVGSEEAYGALQVDVSGKIALAELSFSAPHSEPTRVACAHGAVGLIIINWDSRDGERIHTGTAKSVWGNPDPTTLDRLPNIPVVSVAREPGLQLRELAQAGDLVVRIKAEMTSAWVTAKQPRAWVQGSSDKFILFHGHLDSVGGGMTDNATGSVGLMELARVLTSLDGVLPYSVEVVWWSSHEMPYNGSAWFVDRYWDRLRDKCYAAFNADAWALLNSKNNIQALGSPELRAFEAGVLRDTLGYSVAVGDFSIHDADQSFWGLGTPFGFFFSPTPEFPDGPFLGSWFHSEHDGAEYVDKEALRSLVRLYGVVASRWGTNGSAPPLKPTAQLDAVASQLSVLSTDAPDDAGLADLADAARQIRIVGEIAERRLHSASGRDYEEPVLRVVQSLNSVLYNAAGPWRYDPMAAHWLAHRLPALTKSVMEWRLADIDSRDAILTGLVRERNRVSDALDTAQHFFQTIAGLGD